MQNLLQMRKIYSLGKYKYYDMDDVIAEALKDFEEIRNR